MSSGNTEEYGDLESDSSSSSWEDLEEFADEEAVCHPLLMNSLILEKIFDFLPTKDLLECRRVCREWNKTALLRKVLGSRFEITISKANFDRLLKTAQHSAQPFCRKFEFRLLELEYDKVSSGGWFIRLFGSRLSRLAVKFCTASSSESVIKILNCPRLEELTIYGVLPEIREDNFHKFVFSRLRVVSIISSLDYGQVDKTFIKILLKHAPNIDTVNVGQSISLWTDFCAVYPVGTDSKLCHVGLSGIEGPLEIEHFQAFTKNPIIIRHVNFQNCLVRPTFLGQFLMQTSKQITTLRISGTQQEILSASFRDISLPNLTHITLPIDGISITEGNFLQQSCPKLRRLKIRGVFTTHFGFESSQLTSVTMKENDVSIIFSRATLNQVDEKRREFLKVISVFPLQPLKLEIGLSVAFINGRCIRAVYTQYPNLEHLVWYNCCAKTLVAGFTGVPYRMCRRMSQCKSFAVLYPSKVILLPSLKSLKKLKRLDISIDDDVLSAELVFVLVVYGISELDSLKELSFNNIKISDVALMVLTQKLKLTHCTINGSEDRWLQFQLMFQKHTIKSFLLPPPQDCKNIDSAAEAVGRNSQILRKVFAHLDSVEIFEARKVCNYWRSLASNYLHEGCSSDENLILNLQERIIRYERKRSCPPSPSHRLGNVLQDEPALPKILKVWGSLTKETTLAFVSLEKSVLDLLQYENRQTGVKRTVSCQRKRQLEYWYYPDGSDDLIYREEQIDPNANLDDDLRNIDVLLVIGCFGRKYNGLLEFLNPNWSISKLHLIGLHKEALDLVLPKVTVMMNLESLQIRPFKNSSPYWDITKTHLQILCNSSFKLKQLAMQLHDPSEAAVEFIRSQRFTLENVELHSNVNISDRLTFSIPQLKSLQLDEPPGCLLWTTLNVHSSLETIKFGRSGSSYSQVKNKASPKVDPLDADFEHSATEILCDVNWFLENATCRRPGAQKSILQQGSDSALKFFMHFPYLTSLTLRGVHAHYGILQGIFKKFVQLKKLTLINATGVTDEILTGFSNEILEEIDIMNPFQVTRDRNATKSTKGKSTLSIRNLKCLTHLNLDNQPLCTDFSVIFGVLKLNHLQYFSCEKWKITDVAVRACADILPSLTDINTEGCENVSKHALDYFNDLRARSCLSEE